MKATTYGTVLALLVLAGLPGPAAAADQAGGANTPSPRFQRTDTDRSGDVSLPEFALANNPYLAGADANHDGKMTTAEIADEIVRVRAERMAQRLVKRLDTDGDGAVSPAEVEAGQKARFVRLDKNKGGKLTPDEMPQSRKGQARK